MAALGTIGTGNLTTVSIKEEPSLAGTISSATEVWPMKNRAFFQRLPNIVDSDFANAVSDGISKEVFHTTAGILAAQLDTTYIGYFLKWFVGTKTSTQQGATSEYKHVFKPGVTTLKSCKVFQNVGGMSSALYDDFIGQTIDRMAIIANLLETVKYETVWVGITDQAGAGTGAESYTAENQTISYRDDAGNGAVKYYVGNVGAETIAAMTQWTDPYYMRFDMARNRKVDNFISDGTGKSAGITDGVFRATINLITTLTTNQKYSDFRSGTEKSFGVRLDTGVAIPSGNGNNYKLDIIFPRVTFTNYDMNIDGVGTILPAVNLKPQKDPTAGYEVSFELFNSTTAYADAT